METPRRETFVVAPVRAVAGVLAAAFAAASLHTAGTDWSTLGAAAAAAAATVLVAGVAPWRRLPPAALLVLPVGCDAVIALLRDAQGGSVSGYSPLLVLPVLWVAFVGGRRMVLTSAAAMAVTVLFPILVAADAGYPTSSLRGALLLTGVAAIVGLVTEHVVRALRTQTAVVADRADLLDRLVATHTAIAMSDFGFDDVLATVANAALDLTRAEGAVVELPDGEQMVYRAAAGTAAPFAGLRLPIAGSASGDCLATTRPLVVPDVHRDEHVDREAAQRVGARSMALVPLIHGGSAAGVLKVYSQSPGAVGADEARVLGLLGHVIGTGLARAELLATMAEHAQTDALTGLANRRSWDEQLARAIAHAERTQETVSVAICDVDGLKQVNDREGHAAGDALIRSVADCWRAGARASDLIARIGGDEFALLFPGADEAAAAEIVGRLAEQLPPGRSVSFGVAEWDLRESSEELMARADVRMYGAKRRRAASPSAAA